MLAMTCRAMPGMLLCILGLLCPIAGHAAQSLSLSTNLSGAPDEVVTSDMTISSVGGLAIESLDVRVSYDPSVVDFIAARNGAGLLGGPSSPGLPIFNKQNGLVIISVIGLSVGVIPPEGSVLLELDFRILDTATPGTTEQELVEVLINEELVFSSIGGAPNSSGGSIEVVGQADGDINVDGSVNVVDVMLASRFALGLASPDTTQLAHGNVAPLVGGVPTPTDNQIGVDDLLLIQKKALTGAF